MRGELARNNSVVAARLETLRLSPYYVLLKRWTEACAFAKKHHNGPPPHGFWPPAGATLGAAVGSWSAAARRLLGDEALVTEQAWLAAHENISVSC